MHKSRYVLVFKLLMKYKRGKKKIDDVQILNSKQIEINKNLYAICAVGNIILKNGEPSIHAHITISDHNLDVKGGHLFEAKVGAVGEFILKKIETNGKREFDPKIGLFCMEFNN